ncbi:hypothetical protein INH39_32720 [Massilia violaceinigra]|uniref:DUF1461 domain-containing protein n=1 Tax=Massilia violaceinigra TaxID=2045208 RepID=A0ABY4A8R9_9BURK|nr:hypothetical protein [Massilia violaceinigra]UOD30059.1 hypothetical protein INH39_32720 [Massilia violaceinigra]
MNQPPPLPEVAGLFGPINSWRRALLMLLAGVLLTAVTLVLMNHRVDLRRALQGAPEMSVEAPQASVQSVEIAAYQRAFREERYKRYREAVHDLGFWHVLPFPLIAFFVARDCYRRYKLQFERIHGTLTGNLARIGVFLVYLNILFLIWRFAYFPLVDWIWGALGNDIVAYEHSQGTRSMGRRRSSPYDTGQTMGLLLCLGAWWAWVAVSKGLAWMSRRRTTR